jgi:hypothetical protein
LFRHSERSEESLFDLSIREETKRDSSLRMTACDFFAACSARFLFSLRESLETVRRNQGRDVWLDWSAQLHNLSLAPKVSAEQVGAQNAVTHAPNFNFRWMQLAPKL